MCILCFEFLRELCRQVLVTFDNERTQGIRVGIETSTLVNTYPPFLSL